MPTVTPFGFKIVDRHHFRVFCVVLVRVLFRVLQKNFCVLQFNIGHINKGLEKLTVRNPTGSAAALTITPLAGGTRPVSAHLVITQIG